MQLQCMIQRYTLRNALPLMCAVGEGLATPFGWLAQQAIQIARAAVPWRRSWTRRRRASLSSTSDRPRPSWIGLTVHDAHLGSRGHLNPHQALETEQLLGDPCPGITPSVKWG